MHIKQFLQCGVQHNVLQGLCLVCSLNLQYSKQYVSAVQLAEVFMGVFLVWRTCMPGSGKRHVHARMYLTSAVASGTLTVTACFDSPICDFPPSPAAAPGTAGTSWTATIWAVSSEQAALGWCVRG
jgi:hypothetical protein